MDPESKKLLEKTYEIALENNEMLKKVRGVQKRAFLVSLVKFLIFVGITLGTFYYIEPYLNQFIGIYSNLSGIGAEGGLNTSSGSILDLVKNLEGKISPKDLQDLTR
jgi:hypothetical protein